MRIDSHIFQIILIGVIFIPAFNSLELSLHIIFLIFFGLFCGAIFPDTDCKESRIFKMKQDTRKIGWQSSYKEYKAKNDAKAMYNTFLFAYSSILIILGNLFRYILYYPSYGIVYLINKQWVREDYIKDEHRGISHTLLGVSIASVLFFILIFLLNLYFGLTTVLLLTVPTLSFFISCNVHLLQDSISRWGIKWFYPFNKKIIFGEYTAFNQDRKIIYFPLSLLGSIILIFFISNYIKNNWSDILLISTIVLPIFLLIMSFIILFKIYHAKINY